MERVFDCDPSKRELILKDRHFDLMDMDEVFQDVTWLITAWPAHTKERARYARR